MSVRFYDRDGQPITVKRWHQLYGGNPAARVLVRTALTGHRTLLTVWNGVIDTRRRITLYGSMLVAPQADPRQVGSYDTYATALLGHADLVAELDQRFFCPTCWYAPHAIEYLRHSFCPRCQEVTGPTWPERVA